MEHVSRVRFVSATQKININDLLITLYSQQHNGIQYNSEHRRLPGEMNPESGPAKETYVWEGIVLGPECMIAKTMALFCIHMDSWLSWNGILLH